MAGIDIEAIKKRIAQLNGTAKKEGMGNVWWRPDVGEYKVRVVPFPNNGGQPFKEVWYYKGIGVKNERGKGPFPMPTLKQFNKPDPIQELINALREENNDANKPMLKKLYPKLTTVVAVIVRGEEDKGVRLWGVNNSELYQQLLGYFVDSDVLEETSDWTDLNTGCDLKVKVFESGKVWQGKKVKDIKVEMRIKSTPLSTDPAQVDKWLANIPDVFAVDPVPSYDEAKARLEKWLDAGAGENPDAEGERGGNDSVSSDLDKLQAEVNDKSKTEKAEKPAKSKDEPKEEAKAEKAEKPKPEKVKAPSKKIENTEKDLDQMFTDLENGD